jgi:hypothetical protein
MPASFIQMVPNIFGWNQKNPTIIETREDTIIGKKLNWNISINLSK